MVKGINKVRLLIKLIIENILNKDKYFNWKLISFSITFWNYQHSKTYFITWLLISYTIHAYRHRYYNHVMYFPPMRNHRVNLQIRPWWKLLIATLRSVIFSVQSVPSRIGIITFRYDFYQRVLGFDYAHIYLKILIDFYHIRVSIYIHISMQFYTLSPFFVISK